MSDYFAECAAAGVVGAALPARTPNASWGGTGDAAVVRAIAEKPEFFVGYGALDCSVPNPQQVVTLAASGLVGAVFEPFLANRPRHVDDALFSEMLEACADHEIPVLIMSGGELEAGYGSLGRIARLARSHPKLSIVIVHGGWPRSQDAIQVAFQNANVWLMPDLYFPNLPGEADYLLALRTVLAERMLYGSAFPYTPVADHVARIRTLVADESVLARFFYQNAIDLFRLHDRVGRPIAHP